MVTMHSRTRLSVFLFIVASLPILSHCRYESVLKRKANRGSARRFDPTRVTQLSRSPRAFLYKGFLSDEECDHFINLSKGRLEKSMVADNKSGKSRESNVRTSSGTFLAYAQDEIVAEIEARIATWTFLPVENGESIQVLHYELGQKYEPHYDFFRDEYNQKFGGHRVATVLMYLSNVKKGGETVFPKAEGDSSHQEGDDDRSECAKRGYSVKPYKGDALLFFSLHPNATTDQASLHGSCPVIEGEKWSATKWIHVRSFFTQPLKIDVCADANDNCPVWARQGECDKNPNYMVGVNKTGGHCMKSCGLCSVASS
uniref:procollagen-proline 4-dioxygenase n=1 Tax=Kalanchoe fedtschenkoi TaxID=63787 RepID=A0A7N0U9K8_KALFE